MDKRKFNTMEKAHEGTEKVLLEKDLKQRKIKAAEMELMKNSQNLPEILDTKINELAVELSKMKAVEGLSTLEINELMRGKNDSVRARRKYTSQEIAIIFDAYRKAMVEINKKWKYPPTKENFCSFANISTSLYNNYLQNGDEDTSEIMQQIDDYIRESMLTSAQVGELREITTMFRGKTAHGLVEAQAPIVFEHHSDNDLSKVKELIDTIKSGKSIKTLELEQDKDGVYKPKNKGGK